MNDRPDAIEADLDQLLVLTEGQDRTMRDLACAILTTLSNRFLY